MNSIIGEAHTVSEKVVVCSYPKCGKKGHTAAQCWMRKKEQEKVKLKRAGRSRDFKRSPRESSRKHHFLHRLVDVVLAMCAAPEIIVRLSVLIEQIHMTEKSERSAQRGLLSKQVSLLKTEVRCRLKSIHKTRGAGYGG